MPSPSQPDAGVSPGDILAGKYRVDRVLGQGGMGVVVAAHHLQLDERVAIKFLLPEALRNPEAVARFDREARAAVKIKSEHVARIIDVGRLETGAPYMVMEYLEGSDLSAWLQQRGPLPIEQAVDSVLQACEALAEAHALGIVHRDLKPSNLFCIRRADGQLSIKVLDFGISKADMGGIAGPSMGMTRTAAVIGSPFYMSPEQMQSSRDVNARSDVWSLGVVIYELVTGKPPFDGEAVTDLAIKVAMQPAPSLRALRPDAPPGLEIVVFRCLEKDRAHRYQNVGELTRALQEFGSRRAASSVERVVGTLEAAGAPRPSVLPAGGPGVAVSAVSPARATQGSMGGTIGTSGPGAGAVAAGALGVLVLIAAAALVVVKPWARASQTAANPISASPPRAEPPPSAVSLVASAPTPTPTTAPEPPPAAPPPSTAAPVAPRPTPAAPTRGPSTPTAGSVKNCNPPFYFDDEGTRIFKKECL